MFDAPIEKGVETAKRLCERKRNYKSEQHSETTDIRNRCCVDTSVIGLRNPTSSLRDLAHDRSGQKRDCGRHEPNDEVVKEARHGVTLDPIRLSTPGTSHRDQQPLDGPPPPLAHRFDDAMFER